MICSEQRRARALSVTCSARRRPFGEHHDLGFARLAGLAAPTLGVGAGAGQAR